MSIIAVKGDLTADHVQAVVNAGNTSLWLGAGVAGAIRGRGGPSIQEELYRIAKMRLQKRSIRIVKEDDGTLHHFPCNLGEVVVTHAGDMHAKLVLHAAVMDCLGPHKGETNLDIVAESTRNVMLEARKLGLQYIAFPVLGTGVGRLDFKDAADTMLQTIRNYLIGEMYVYLYGFTNQQFMTLKGRTDGFRHPGV